MSRPTPTRDECPIWAEFREAAEAAILDLRADPDAYPDITVADVWRWAESEYDYAITGRIDASDGYDGPTWYEGMGWA